MRFDLQQTGDGIAVAARGRLTVSRAALLRQALLEALAAAKRVEVVLQDVQEADLSLLQLLCAAQRSAARRGVSLRINGLETAVPVQQLIRQAGVLDCASCAAGCLWRGAAPSGERRREP